MKKLFLIILLSILTLGTSACTIVYNGVETPGDSTTNDSQDSNENENENQPETESKPQETPESEIINADAFFYPSTLTLESKEILDYTYVDDKLKNNYQIYSAYYSNEYDTIYIAYDNVDSPIQTLKAKDLYEIEQHAINYFKSDESRKEDTEYLKAVRIYPDALASSCRKNATDNEANNINGCANYGGKEATIDLNKITNMDDFYNEKRTPINEHQYKLSEPMRDTFAHEYGHVSTFYHMAYKNDENYEDYLKLRLGELFDTIYPGGLPNHYTSNSGYYIQPEEILADDFVELFYDTSTKVQDDLREYTLEYSDMRNSLSEYDDNIKFLKQNTTLYNQIKTYYENNFLNYENKIIYTNPIVISQSGNQINYYESYSKIGDVNNKLTIDSLNSINLIAVGEVTINSEKYYRVILSNTIKIIDNYYNQKDIGKKLGYVKASDYETNNNLNIYKVKEASELTLYPISDTQTSLYLMGYYDFSYVLELDSNETSVTSYDYLASELTNHTYQIQKNFIELIK